MEKNWRMYFLKLEKIFRETWAIALRDIKKESLIQQIIFIFIFLALILLIGNSIDQFFGITYSNMNYTSFLSAGIIVYLIAIASLNVGLDLILDSKGFIKTLLVAPISRISIFLGKILSLIITSSRTFLIIAFLLMIYLNSINLNSILLLLFTCISTILIFVSLGFLIAALIKETKTAQMIINYGSIILFLFSGVFFPIQGFSKIFQYMLFLNPLFYLIEAMRFSFSGNSTIPISIILLIIFILLIIIPFFSVFLFDKMMRK